MCGFWIELVTEAKVQGSWVVGLGNGKEEVRGSDCLGRDVLEWNRLKSSLFLFSSMSMRSHRLLILCTSQFMASRLDWEFWVGTVEGEEKALEERSEKCLSRATTFCSRLEIILMKDSSFKEMGSSSWLSMISKVEIEWRGFILEEGNEVRRAGLGLVWGEW